MSTTPRTDAAVFLTIAPGYNSVCPNFARQLERELADAKKDTARLEHLIRKTYPSEFIQIIKWRALADSIAAIDAAMEAGK